MSEIDLKSASTRLRFATSHDADEVLENLATSLQGLNEEWVDISREQYGSNKLTHGKKDTLSGRLVRSFVNPFTLVLFVLAAVSTCTDIIWAKPEDVNPATVIIITTMVLISGVLRFIQEARSGKAAEKLLTMIKTTAKIERAEVGAEEIPLEEIVVGDIVHISAGDMIPADMRIIRAKDLFVSQSSLTGESEPVEKFFDLDANYNENTPLVECRNLAFMGTNVVSGSAVGVVVATGDATLFGDVAKNLRNKPVKTMFEKGVNSVSWVLIRFMLIMVPVVFFVNGMTKGNWMEAFMFAISIAVGLTPEMLPMIVTTSLAKGAMAMSRKKTIIKNLNAIQNLGSIDILCTDKTGTLTQDKVVLQYHFDVQGNQDVRVLRHAFLNSYYQTGLKNLMDIAIISRTHEEEEEDTQLVGLATRYVKVDEVPWDFERRRMSVVVEDQGGKTQMITKGAVEEMLSVCSFAEYDGKTVPITEEIKSYILEKVEELNESGMRVVAVAQKAGHSPVGAFSKNDEADMVLMGYLAFLDPPKDSAEEAIEALKRNGISVKVLTGDNDKVTRSVCKHIGLDAETILLGSDIEKMDDKELSVVAEEVSVFAKLSPQQKARIVSVLRNNGHSVGYMGDGINDTTAMKVADVGISVDTAVDIAKESSSVILLEKDLMVLENGIMAGRKTYANMIKYIKMTASSNFGNMFSVLVASAFLPFMPMLSLHLILLNLIYDISCTSIPWDNVDSEFVRNPRKWDASALGKFMIWIGPTSSVFDITTYLLLYFVICPAATGGVLFHHLTDPGAQTLYVTLFQSGWFVESMWTQALVIHMLRTPKLPFIQSRASFSVFAMTFAGIAVVTAIPFTSIGRSMGFSALPWEYFGWLAVTVFAYMVLVTVVKHLFVRRYGELL